MTHEDISSVVYINSFALFGKSRVVGLSPHLILRTHRADSIDEGKEDMGWTGNVLFDRMVGSTIYTCTAGEVRR